MGVQTFAHLIKERRDALGLSQARLGQLVGRSASTIRNWERAQSAPSERVDVVALAAVLGLDERQVLEEAGFEPTEVEERPTMEQAYASLTHEAVSVAPPPSSPVVTRPVDEPGSIEAEKESSSSPPEQLVPDQPESTSPILHPSDDIVAEEETDPEPAPAPADVLSPVRPVDPDPGSPEDRPAVRDRTRRAAPPTVLESVRQGELSYIEDPEERDRYRIRALATAAIVIALLIVLLWSYDRATDALGGLWGELIDSLDF